MRQGLLLLASTPLLLSAGPHAIAQAQQSQQPQACVTVNTNGTPALCIAPGSGRTVWFRDCERCPQMVVIPGGRMDVGEDRQARNIVFEKPFAIGRFAVTFDEWDACVTEGGCGGYSPRDNGWGRDNRPVINVNWADAALYVAWLSRKTGHSYSLPTEEQREYATRAGTRTRYWSGSSITLDQANYDLPVPSRRRPGDDWGDLEKVRRRTVPVDSFSPNPWGLFNVHGNVWEWTSNCWRREMPASEAPATPAGSTTCGRRVARGGSWNDFAYLAASGARIGFAAASRNPMQGFRVVRQLR